MTRIREEEEDKEYAEWYYIGVIANMLLIFEPVTDELTTGVRRATSTRSLLKQENEEEEEALPPVNTEISYEIKETLHLIDLDLVTSW